MKISSYACLKKGTVHQILCRASRSARSPDVGINIDRRPDVDIVFVELDAVGIALVPVLDDGAFHEFPHIGLDLVANLETKGVRNTARHKPVPEELVVEVLSDKDESRLALRFGLGPLAFVKAAGKDHSNALKDKLLVHSLDGQDTLVAIQVGTIFGDESLDPSLHEIDVDGISLDLAAHRGDTFVMHVLTVLVQKVWLEFEDAVQFKGLDVEELLRVHLAMLGASDADRRVELLEFLLDLFQFGVVRNKINLVEKDLVGKGNLFDGFVLHTLGLFFVEAFHNVLCVNDGDDGIESVLGLDVIVHEKGLDDGGRIGETSGLDNNPVELVDALVEFLESLHKISSNGTADAAVHDLDDFLVDILRQNILVDTHFTEFILDNSEFHAMVLVIENVIEKRRLSASQKSRKDRHYSNIAKTQSGPFKKKENTTTTKRERVESCFLSRDQRNSIVHGNKTSLTAKVSFFDIFLYFFSIRLLTWYKGWQGHCLFRVKLLLLLFCLHLQNEKM